MWLDKLKYRDNLGLPSDITFGVEIEFADARRKYIEETLKEDFQKKKISSPWTLKFEKTIFSDQETSYIKGGEAISSILSDDKKTWDDIKHTCDIIKLYNGTINTNCGAHVHIGANILEDNMKYYDRLIKLLVIYEDIILRFCYGEDNKPRNNINIFAGSPYVTFKIICNYFYYNNKFNLSFDDFVSYFDNYNYKNLSVSFCRLNRDYLEKEYNITNNWKQSRTLEFRGGNGTLNPAVWQNYINLYTKLLLCCKDDTKDWHSINRKFGYAIRNGELDDYDMYKAVEFSDFVFDNDLDKNNFILQYVKDDRDIKVKKRQK